jgi:hypothetical protein
VLLGNALGTGLTYSREMTMAVQILFFIGMWEEKYTGVCRTTAFDLIGTSEYLTGFILTQLASPWLPQGNPLISPIRLWFTADSAAVGALVCTVNVVTKCKSLRPLADLLVIAITNWSFLVFVPVHERSSRISAHRSLKCTRSASGCSSSFLQSSLS